MASRTTSDKAMYAALAVEYAMIGMYQGSMPDFQKTAVPLMGVKYPAEIVPNDHASPDISGKQHLNLVDNDNFQE